MGFGTIRKLPSGRFQVRYFGPDGVRHSAPHTFDTKSGAKTWLRLCESDVLRGTWSNPRAMEEKLSSYGAAWISQRHGLANSTRELYSDLFRLHIEPYLGHKTLTKVTPSVVRQWNAERRATVGHSTVAKAYRLLRAIFNTAVEDQLVTRNPCRIKGGGVETPEERPVVQWHEVQLLAAAMPDRFSTMVYLAVAASLRWGEVVGLQRQDCDLENGLIMVRRSVVQHPRNGVEVKEPKSRAGLRTVAIPPVVIPILASHIESYAQPSRDGFVFTGERGGVVGKSQFYKVWNRARRKVGLTHIRFHDLRHAGNHLAAQTGASTRELMARMGHSSMSAALMYQHRTAQRDRAIADKIADVIGHELGTAKNFVSDDGGV